MDFPGFAKNWEYYPIYYYLSFIFQIYYAEVTLLVAGALALPQPHADNKKDKTNKRGVNLFDIKSGLYPTPTSYF